MEQDRIPTRYRLLQDSTHIAADGQVRQTHNATCYNLSTSVAPKPYTSMLRALLFLISACLLTWPLVLNLASHLPLGTEPAATVPLFNLWTLLWNAKQIRFGYPAYWDAPIFHPTSGTFALSDPQPLSGAVFAALYALTGQPVLAYNLLLLLVFALNGYAVSRLLETLSIPQAPALFGGLLAQSLLFVGNELGVLHLTVLFLIALTLEAVIRFTRQPSFLHAIAGGIWTAVTFLTSSYYGLFLSIMLVCGGVIFVRRTHLRGLPLLQLVCGICVAAALLFPVLPAQAWLTAQYVRSDETIRQNSAQPIDYLRLGSNTWGNGRVPWLRTSGGSGQRLYPSTLLLALAGLGVLVAWREKQRG